MKHFCTNCGSRIEAGARFCESCGLPIAPAVPTPTPAAASVAQGDIQKPKLKSRRAMWLTSGIALLAVLGAVVAEYALPSRPVTKAISSFVQKSSLPGSTSMLYMVGAAGKWGYVDGDGTVVIPLEYDEPPLVGVENNKTKSVIFRAGPPYPLYKSSAWILTDKTGKQLGSNTFSKIHSRPFGPICGQHNGMWACVDGDGKLVVPFSAHEVSVVGQNLIAVHKGENWGLLDYRGSVVREPQFKSRPVFVYENLLAVVKFSDGMYGLIDQLGGEVTTTRHPAASTPSKSHWPVKTTEGWAFADLRGNVLTPIHGIPGDEIKWVFAPSKERGLAPVHSRGASWIVNTAGNIVFIPNKWLMHPAPFFSGLSRFWVSGQRYGFIDENGGVALPAVFKSAAGPVDGRFIVEAEEGKVRLIDTAGVVKWPKTTTLSGVRKLSAKDIDNKSWTLDSILSVGNPDDPFFNTVTSIGSRIAFSRGMIHGTDLSNDYSAGVVMPLSDQPDGWITFGAVRINAQSFDGKVILMSDFGSIIRLIPAGGGISAAVDPPLSQRSAQAQSSGSADSSGAADKVIETSVRYILDREWSGACQFSVKIGELFLAFDMLPMSEPHIRNQDFDGYERFRAKGWIIIDRILNPGHMNNGKIRVSASPATVAISTPCKNADTNQFKFYSPAKYTFKRMVSVERYKGGVDNFVVVSFTYDAQEEKNQIWQDYCSSFSSKSITCTGNNNSRKAKLLLKLDKFSDSRPWKSVGGSDSSDIDKEFSTNYVADWARHLQLQPVRQ